jgi:hypothetical protein
LLEQNCRVILFPPLCPPNEALCCKTIPLFKSVKIGFTIHLWVFSHLRILWHYKSVLIFAVYCHASDVHCFASLSDISLLIYHILSFQ